MISFLLGLLGGAWHLVVLAARATALPRGAGRVLLAAPVGLLGPIAAIAAALAFDASHAWAVLPGLIVARLLLLRPLAHRVEGPWS